MSNSNMILHHIKSVHNSSTQILNGLGTTDVAIGVHNIINYFYWLYDCVICHNNLIQLSLHRMHPQRL